VRETKDASLLAGTTREAQDGQKSSTNSENGKLPLGMLLAMLNSTLTDMQNCQQAEILGTAMTRKGRATIILVYGVEPTAEGLLEVVGNA
jgi:hypothetical protein